MRKIFLGLPVLLFGLFIFFKWQSGPALAKNQKFDKLVVLKSERKLQAYANGKLLKTYNIALGRNPIGDKKFEGDFKTPEGRYIIHDKNPNSGYHKNLGISYPNKQDIDEARLLGKPTGGDIKIHGMRNGFGFLSPFHKLMDWTYGCIAVTNADVEELCQHTPIGTPIIIKP